ncbi:MAG: Photosynthesis system assembly factor [Ignavibacteria bacterium]|nr:Photosynthesis system assembly factor [Ignavibacteria bacterium]
MMVENILGRLIMLNRFLRKTRLLVLAALFLYLNLEAQKVISDTCLPKGYNRNIDSTITESGNDVKIYNFDFTEQVNQLLIGGNTSQSENVILTKGNNNWKVIFRDRSVSNKSEGLIHNPKMVTDYKRIGNYFYILCGRHGYVMSGIYDSVTNKTYNVDTVAAKAYILVGNLLDSTFKKIIKLEEYYANQFFYFENYGWIVAGQEYIYKFSKDFDTLYEKLPITPSELKEYRLTDVKYFINTQTCAAISPDTIYFNFVKITDAQKMASIPVYEAALYRTVDGCKSFEKLNLPINKFGYIYFKNALEGYYSGQFYFYPYAGYVSMISFIFRTKDGCKTWDTLVYNNNYKININFPVPVSCDYGAYMKFYNNGRLGVSTSSNTEIYLSTDYGSNWKQLVPFDTVTKCFSARSYIGYFSNCLYNGTLYWGSSFETRYFTYSNEILGVEDVVEMPIEINSGNKFLISGDYLILNDELLTEIKYPADYILFSSIGQLLKSSVVIDNRIDLSGFPAGVYTIIINQSTKIMIIKY